MIPEGWAWMVESMPTHAYYFRRKSDSFVKAFNKTQVGTLEGAHTALKYWIEYGD